MKYALIIDGHNFLFRSLYVLPQKKNVRLLSDDESKDLFVSKLSQNINAVLRDMSSVADRCILTLDSHSWRNDLESDISYKGTRHQEDTIDWDGFRECIDRFVADVEKYNVVVSKTKNAEADDLIFMWTTALTSKNIPVIIYTSDRDMLQLVNISQSNCDVVLWSEVTKKIYVPENFSNMQTNESESFVESFMKGSNVDIYDRFVNIEQSIRKHKLEKIETDSTRFIYTKVLVGDKSDNISSVYSYEKNGRTFNVTENKAEKIIDKFVEKAGPLNPEYLYIDETLSALAQTCVEILNGAEYESVLKNIKRNIKYMVLSKQVIPEEVSENMMNDIKALAKNMKRINTQVIVKNDEPVVKISESVLKGINENDYSFIKKKNTLF